jgi:hypothetical protein
MPVDRYTKLVLTVIAVCLVWIAVGGPSLITPLSAQNDRVYLQGWIDERGGFRPFPAYPPAGVVEPGKMARPAPLPVWDVPSNRNP